MGETIIAPERKTIFQERRVILPRYPQLENIDSAVEELKNGKYKEGLDAVIWIGRNNRECVAKRKGKFVLTKADLQALYDFDWLKEDNFNVGEFKLLYDYTRYLARRYSSKGFDLQIQPDPSERYFEGIDETVICTPNIILFMKEKLEEEKYFLG